MVWPEGGLGFWFDGGGGRVGVAMTSEQKQKKVLFISLALLVLGGILLCAVAKFEHRPYSPGQSEQGAIPSTTSESLAAPVVIREQPGMSPQEKAEPVVIGADWKTYKNAKYGIEFRYPKEWPAPVFAIVEGMEGYEGSGVPLWELGVGKQENACEGQPCYLLGFEGFTSGPQDSREAIVQSLMENSLAQITAEKKINGADVVVFMEGGMCGYRNAWIFGKDYIIKFTAHCGEDDPELAAMFDAILSTFKLTK